MIVQRCCHRFQRGIELIRRNIRHIEKSFGNKPQIESLQCAQVVTISLLFQYLPGYPVEVASTPVWKSLPLPVLASPVQYP